VRPLKKKLHCPKCKEEIEHLENVQTGTATWIFDLNRKRQRQYSRYPDFASNGGDNYFGCPLCYEVLFYDEDKAAEFLGEEKHENK
jgi:uncharacterized protein YbaR (Trm112 family)